MKCLILLTSAIKCPLLAPIVNGIITGTGLRVGSTATYECFDGFVLVGVSVRTCLNTGHWSGKEPSCKRKHKSIKFHS